MHTSSIPTASSTPVNTVFAIALPEALVRQCRRAVSELVATRVEVVGVAELSGIIAERRPLAIVLTTDVYEFDSARFEDMAAAVGACCVRIDTTRVDNSSAFEVLRAVAASAIGRRAREGR